MLVEKHAPAVYRLAAAIVGESSAPDVTQETFVAAWQQLPRLRRTDAFEAWLRRICVNRSRNWLRTERRRPTASAGRAGGSLMNDEQIVAYLRSRARVEPPIGLTRSVMTDVAALSPHRSWFAAFVPAAGAAGLVVGMAVLALLVVKPPSAAPTASPSFPIVTSDPRYPACAGGMQPDQVVAAFPFVAADYQRHFPKMGRSPELEVNEPAFAVVFTSDVPVPGLLPGINRSFPSPPSQSGLEHLVCIYVGQPPEGTATFYENVDITGMRAELESPAPTTGTPTPAATEPATPSPVPATPSPSPAPGYVQKEGLPFSVLDNVHADALFTDVATCVSESGYRVSYPASWYTNEATAATPACSWFGPEPFEGSIRPVVVKPGPPNGVWIYMEVFNGSAGYTGETPIYYSEQISIGGYDGHRAEYGPDMGATTATPSPDRGYWYLIPVDNDGPTFIAATNSGSGPDYELAKAVLDRMMASISFRILVAKPEAG